MSTFRQRFNLLCVLLALLALQACSSLVQLPPSANRSGDLTKESLTATQALTLYSQVLQNNVNEKGEVDFLALSKAPQDLERYLSFVATLPLASLSNKTEKLAHLINTYNALSMYNVVRSGIPATHAGLKKVSFFVLKKHRVGGVDISLYDLENDLIRPIGDPRIHFALNCSARACPTLPRKPFTVQNLDAELDAETKAFFASPLHLRVEPGANRVWVSEILKFYTEDFLPPTQNNSIPVDKNTSLISYINRYVPRTVPVTYELTFIPYDWTIANWQR